MLRNYSRRELTAAFCAVSVAVVLLYISYQYYWHIPRVPLGLFWSGFALLAMAEFAAIHTGKQRFRFRLAAQLPLLIHVGLFPVLLSEVILLFLFQLYQLWKVRTLQVYLPRILSALIVPTVSASAYLNLMTWMHAPMQSPQLLAILFGAGVFWLTAVCFRYAPGSRTIMHPWTPPKYWLPILLVFDALLAVPAVLPWNFVRNILPSTLSQLESILIIAILALYTDANIRRSRIVNLTYVMKDVASETSLSHAVEGVLLGLRSLFAFDVAVMWTLRESLDLCATYVQVGEEAGKPLAEALLSESPTYRLGQGFIGFVASSNEALRVDSMQERTPFTPLQSLSTKACAMAAPVYVGTELYGVIAIYHNHSVSAYRPSHCDTFALAVKQFSAVADNIVRFEASHKQSQVDDLTGLHNFRYFDEALQNMFHSSEQTATPMTMLLLDIDHFKQVNDKYGHVAGNQVLMQMSAILQTLVRDGDVVARYGGEEFTVLLPGLNEQEGHIIAERIRLQVEKTVFEVDDHLHENMSLVGTQAKKVFKRRIQITLSIGVASFPDSADSPLTLLRNADRAMYVGSKQSGRNRVASYRML